MSGRTTAVDLPTLLEGRRVIVCCGSGGVGKTTVSAALAMAIVARQDLRVLVLTVDPARRLATALGLEAVGTEPVVISPARLRRAGINPRGELVAAMLDTKSAWDRLIDRHAPSPRSAATIKANRFYQGISDAFTGSHEYMAMETLYELDRAGEYDVLVIDTPPSRNALDFLEAPSRLADFVGGRLLSWLARPSRVGFRALNFAATPFLKMADRLLGGEVLGELVEFTTELQGLYAGIQEHARAVERLLRSDATGFVVVTSLEPQPVAEARFFCERLRAMRMPLDAIVVNRVLPPVLRDQPAARAAAAMVEDPRAVAGALAGATGDPVDPAALTRIGEAFRVLHRMAVANERQVAGLADVGGAPVVRIPLAERDVVDLDGLAQVTAALGGTAEAEHHRPRA